MSSLSFWIPWPKRYWKIGITRRPDRFSASARWSASRRDPASGFSQITCRPASRAWSVCATCREGGVQMSTMSRSSIAQSAPKSVTARGMACAAASWRPFSRSRSQIATTSNCSGRLRYASTCARPMPPPTTPTFNAAFTALPSGPARVLCGRGSADCSQPDCLGFGLQCQLAGQEAMRLRHGGLGPIENVGDQVPSVRQIASARLHVLGGLAVDHEQVVSARTPGDIHVLPELDVALGAEDDEAAISPRAEPVRGVPVHPDVARPAVAAQHDLAEVLELRPVRELPVGDLGGYHFRLGGAREEEELIRLVRGDVGEDSPVLRPLEEPRRATGRIEPVRSEARGVDDPADGPRADQLPRPHGGGILEPLA